MRVVLIMLAALVLCCNKSTALAELEACNEQVLAENMAITFNALRKNTDKAQFGKKIDAFTLASWEFHGCPRRLHK